MKGGQESVQRGGEKVASAGRNYPVRRAAEVRDCWALD